jgi:hypothetical protein
MFEQPGKLYLGREYDLDLGRVTDKPVFVGARDLTTHAVCLGMTGTGKTGLGVVALEEVLMQGVPCIIVDPKGDITNLALSFPELQPADFLPWLDADEAARQNLSPEQLAAATAQKWRDGLHEWGIGPERIAALRDRAKFDIYTPGSDAGLPVNVLQSLSPPSDPSITWARNTETLRERISQLCQALLELVGIEADPMQSREHILLATIFEASWRAGQPLDITALIQQIQSPPVTRVGAFDMDVFYPRDERFDLAMRLNNLMAAPSFGVWTQGAPMDIATFIKPDREAGGSNPAGKTRCAIFYLAHLGEGERQFFTTLLLSQLVLWMRSQTGTSSLRCLVYFDEVYGYCPPYPRNPPTKQPLMTIIKQGRAAGLGAFLATQNPADLDYKGLANIGTWFIGRLRTGRDRDRALEGLEGAGAGFDRDHFEGPLSTLPPRVFLLQSTTGSPRFLQSRWAMSYLRGPLTRDQVSVLEPGTEVEESREITERPFGDDSRLEIAEDLPVTLMSPDRARQSSIQNRQSKTENRPQLPPDVREVFLPANSALGTQHSALAYAPHLLASASVRITDRASGVNASDRYTFLVPLGRLAQLPDFAQANMRSDIDIATLQLEPLPTAAFAPLPSGINGRWMKQAERLLIEHVYRFGVTEIFFNRTLKLYGQPGETQLEFRERCETSAREKRNAEAQKVRAQYERRMQTLQDRVAREHRELAQDRTELGGRQREELLGGVESLFNFVFGRRQSYAVAFGARRRREVESAQQDVRESEAAIAKLQQDLRAVAGEYKDALNALSDKWMRALSDVTQVPLAPKKSDIFVDVVALAWVP